MTFSKSIGHSGSREISSTSIGQSRASGGAVSGYSDSKSWGAQGKPAPEFGARGHVAGTASPPSQRASRAPDIGRVGVNSRDPMPRPSRT
jgi:hypothetical protein